MTRIITIASGKGGVGKTTSAINLGAAFNSFGKEVVVIDANLTTPNVGLHLGAPIVPVSLNHVLSGKAKIVDAIYEHESGTKVIPSSLSVKDLRSMDQSKLKDVSKRVRKMADIVLLDCAAGLGDEAVAAFDAADDIILVTNPEIPAVTDALKAAKMAEEMGKNILGVVVTRVSDDSYQMPLENISEMLELPIIGIVPEDRNVRRSVVMKDALVHTHPKSGAAKAYKKLAARIIGVDYEEKGFWASLFS